MARERLLTLDEVEFIVWGLMARDEIDEQLAEIRRVKPNPHRDARYRELRKRRKALENVALAERAGVRPDDVQQVSTGSYCEMETVIANRWFRKQQGLNFA